MNVYTLDEEALRKGWGSTEQHWFSLHSYRIVDYRDLSSLDIPSGISQNSYFISIGYIPYFYVSNNEVILKFINSVEERKLKEALSKIENANLIEAFWKYVNAYPALADKYSAFEDKYILEKAIGWCEENGIRYEVKI